MAPSQTVIYFGAGLDDGRRAAAGACVLGGSADAARVLASLTPGTRIKTIRGEIAVELLQAGDRVLTRDNGFQTVRWAGTRTVGAGELVARPELQPIEIAPGALGPGRPERVMRVSPQHRMLMEGYGAQMHFGADEVLVAARDLTRLPGVRPVAATEITYCLVMFDRHEIVLADGAWTESFQPGAASLAALDTAARGEILALFPALAGEGAPARAFEAARMTVDAREVELLTA